MARRTAHSKMGRWSFRLSLVSGGVFLLSFLGLLFMKYGGYLEDTSTPPRLAILLVLVMLICLLFVLVAFVLGVAGMLQRRRKKKYAVLGACVSVLVLVVAYYAWLVPVLKSQGRSLPLS
jgi:uncharacterized membrane protein